MIAKLKDMEMQEPSFHKRAAGAKYFLSQQVTNEDGSRPNTITAQDVPKGRYV
jgi:hypothetical protein